MDVARVGVDRAHQDRAHQPHDRRLFVFDALGRPSPSSMLFFRRRQVGHLHVDDRLPGDDPVVEAAVERGLHRVVERHHRVDVIAGDQLRFGDCLDVVRRDHRQLQRAAGDRDRHAGSCRASCSGSSRTTCGFTA